MKHHSIFRGICLTVGFILAASPFLGARQVEPQGLEFLGITYAVFIDDEKGVNGLLEKTLTAENATFSMDFASDGKTMITSRGKVFFDKGNGKFTNEDCSYEYFEGKDDKQDLSEMMKAKIGTGAEEILSTLESYTGAMNYVRASASPDSLVLRRVLVVQKDFPPYVTFSEHQTYGEQGAVTGYVLRQYTEVVDQIPGKGLLSNALVTGKVYSRDLKGKYHAPVRELIVAKLYGSEVLTGLSKALWSSLKMGENRDGTYFARETSADGTQVIEAATTEKSGLYFYYEHSPTLHRLTVFKDGSKKTVQELSELPKDCIVREYAEFSKAERVQFIASLPVINRQEPTLFMHNLLEVQQRFAIRLKR
jgi:hypothetical protein